MINLHCLKRRKLCLIKEEKYEQKLVQEVTQAEESRALLHQYNASHQHESPASAEPAETDKDTIEAKRSLYLDQLRQALIEFDALSRTTDLLKGKQHLSLQTCSRPATSFRNPPQPVSARIASRKADLQLCGELFSKGLQQSRAVGAERHLFALDCLSLRRHWKLVLSPAASFGVTSKDLVGSTAKEQVHRIGKNDFLAIDCSYASVGDHYNSRHYTQVNRHLPFIVQLSIGPRGAALRATAATPFPAVGGMEIEVAEDERAIVASGLSTLHFSLQQLEKVQVGSGVSSQWRRLASTTSYETLRVKQNNVQYPEFLAARTKRKNKGGQSSSSDIVGVRPARNLLDMMEMDDSEEEEDEDNDDDGDQGARQDNPLAVLHAHCRCTQHDHFCRRLFGILMAEAMSLQQEGQEDGWGLVVSGESLQTHDTDIYDSSIDKAISSLTVDSALFSALQVTALSRCSVSIALSASLSMTISLVKQADKGHSSPNKCYEKCLSKCILSLETQLLARFENSRRVQPATPTSLKDAYKSRFPSLHKKCISSNSSQEERGRSAVMLKNAQELVQQGVWGQRVQEIVAEWKGRVKCAWRKQARSQLGNGEEEPLLVLSKGSDSTTGYSNGDSNSMCSSRPLILRIHPTCVKVEDFSPASLSVSYQPPQFSNESLLRKYLETWLAV